MTSMNARDVRVGDEVTLYILMDDEYAFDLNLYDEIPAVVSTINEDSVEFIMVRHNSKSMQIEADLMNSGMFTRHIADVNTDAIERAKSGAGSTISFDVDNDEFFYFGETAMVTLGITRALMHAQGALHYDYVAEGMVIGSSDEVKGETWFHATENKLWGEQVSGMESYEYKPAMVHLGTEEAALARLGVVNSSKESARAQEDIVGWVFEVRIADDAAVAPQMLNDMGSDWFHAWSPATHGEHNVFAYENEVEDEGSVSLYTRADMIEVVGVRAVRHSDVDAKASSAQRNRTLVRSF